MRSYVKVSLWVVVGFILIVPATYRVAAEPDPGSVQGHQGMGGMQHGSMQPAMTPTDKLMQDLGTMMADLTIAMRDFRTSHEAMAGQSRGPLVASMQGMLDQMRQFQESLHQMATAETLMPDAGAMKTIQQAGRDFQQMGKAYQAMLKSMDKAMKNAHRETGR